MNNNLCNCDMGLVDITGICDPDDVTAVISQYPYWFQMYLPEIVKIPPQKPDAEQINSLNASVSILRTKVIKTPISPVDANGKFIPSLEGKISTGRKIIVEGQLCQKVTYTATDDVQSVHSAHFYVPFSSYIVVPKTISFTNGTTTVTVDSLDIEFQVNACIENLSIQMLDPRTILKQVTLLLYAVPSQSI